MKLRSFEITEAANGGWLLMNAYGRSNDGSYGFPQALTGAYSSSADLIEALSDILNPVSEAAKFFDTIETLSAAAEEERQAAVRAAC